MVFYWPAGRCCQRLCGSQLYSSSCEQCTRNWLDLRYWVGCLVLAWSSCTEYPGWTIPRLPIFGLGFFFLEKVASDLCKRQGYRGGPLSDSHTSHQLLVSWHFVNETTDREALLRVKYGMDFCLDKPEDKSSHSHFVEGALEMEMESHRGCQYHEEANSAWKLRANHCGVYP